MIGIPAEIKDNIAMTKKFDFSRAAQNVIEIELDAISQLKERIGANFTQACELLLHCTGRIVVIGMGKSGHIANKIAATLASTGSPAFFVHPAEASHGDLGMIVKGDVVIALSNSGNTEEILTILPVIKRLKIPLVSLTGNPNSELAKNADVNLDVSVEQEACPLNLAPTASTTAALVMGDALALALLEARGYTEDDFALTHPSGSLGRRLLLKVKDLMHTGNSIPQVKPDTTVRDALLEMTQKRLGMTTITSDGKLEGIFTDGDIRRAIDKNVDFQTTAIKELMTKTCKTTTEDTLAYDALNTMDGNKITSLVVIDKHNNIQGVLHMHDLLQAKVR